MGQEKGQNQWKTHEFLNFDVMMHKREGVYLVSLNSMSMFQIQIYFRRMWETPQKQTYRLNAVSYSSEI